MASRCSTMLIALLLFSLGMTTAYQFHGCTILGEGCNNDADCSIICQEDGQVLKSYRCINDPTGRDRGTVCCCTFQ
ncbi:hypothetical protein BHE74_00051224 [Ensete ventricosum]|uniref:Uncharacterized protein n=1 Tax=Ensete ventricosum TaxID=4639 RepID=A0A444C6Y8_ENSVE|nr:hypothetical protein B296_00008824 [Ensete ventricosum]RWV81635.1 hypothetical protein GW17_00056925 [Ensete ventricosum]RWW43147.1 hypothetical protein BHE74_00051224 [Ensete ventricosum]RZS03532.1 hypothetical protein BHM03_00033723 [Ensete ventricosum]